MAQKTSWTGAGLTQSDINTYLMHEGGAWTTWTPTVTQSGGVSVAVLAARYARAGRLIHFYAGLSVTGSGTGSNDISLSLPVTAASSGFPIGTGEIYDASANIVCHGTLVLTSTTACKIRGTTPVGSPFYLGGASFTAALASGDAIGYSGFYEAAS